MWYKPLSLPAEATIRSREELASMAGVSGHMELE